MKKLTAILIMTLLVTAMNLSAESLSKDRQEKIIEAFLYVSGQGTNDKAKKAKAELSTQFERPLKCGTPAVADFVVNLADLDKELLNKFSLDPVLARPVLSDSIASPLGLFMVHYTTTGVDAVYQSGVQTGGIPNYVLKVADILDSTYLYTIDTLGYPVPPSDDFYPSGGDSKFDVYLKDIGGDYFGLTWADSIGIDGPGTQRATSFMELDNDYAEILIYQNRPLDAVRVTAAHEYFHAVQFGIDYFETETGRRYWMEMSSTWMEEEQYDDINDYYYYLPSFYNLPRASIQQFNSIFDLHPYGSVVFPIFLTEKYGRDVIREIWLRCAENLGDDFLRVTQNVIDSVTSGAETFHTIFAEFAAWNYFTGERAIAAPAGVGYTERNNYPKIPDDGMALHNQYPFIVATALNPYNPDHNGAFYINFADLTVILHDTTYWRCDDTTFVPCTDSIIDINPGDGYHFISGDTTYWNCNTGILPNCTDSTLLPDGNSGFDMMYIDTTYWECLAGTNPVCADSTKVNDPMLGYDYITVDSSFTIGVAFDNTFNQPWGLSLLYQDASVLDSFEVEHLLLPGATGHLLKVPEPHLYRSITAVLTPASHVGANYSPSSPIGIAYGVSSESDIDPEKVNLPSAVLYPYPNPAVVANMPEESIFFRFQMETNETSFPGRCADSIVWIQRITDPFYTFDFVTVDTSFWRCFPDVVTCTDSLELLGLDTLIYEWKEFDTTRWVCLSDYGAQTGVYMMVDIFSVAGERVASIASDQALSFQGSFAHGDRVIGWDMKNDAGEPVASGAYLAYARMYTAVKDGKFIAEAKAKIAIIR